MKRCHILFIGLALTALSACQTSNKKIVDDAKLNAVLEAQSDDHQSRYAARHPKETLTFMGIAPGDTVVEIMPGGGWYSSILGPYIGPEGALIGVDYSLAMMRHFDWVTDSFIENRKNWGNEWKAKGRDWPGAPVAKLEAYTLADVPASLNGKVDSVLFFRALHNLSRFESKGGYRTKALARTFDLLKPGGTVGIVQHQVDESRNSDWADGSKGYLKKSDVIAWMADAGFEFVAASPINQNPKDTPTMDEIVWRLAPSFYTSQDNPTLKAEYAKIGESNRMTLLFRKP